jgi:hypothetical protein
MTRCLACGAERTGDQCEACGLTSDAAEIVLRHQLMIRTAWFLGGALLFVSLSQVFPPLELDEILIFIGILFFAGLAIAAWIDVSARRRTEVEVLKRIFFGLVPVPWIAAALIFCNGKFDTAPQHREPARVIGRFNMPGLIFKSRRLVVTSWRDQRDHEDVPVESYDYDRFHVGDDVFVGVEPGFLDIPWVYAVYRDDSRVSPSSIH